MNADKLYHGGRIYIESLGYQLSFVQQPRAEGLPVEPVRRDRGQHEELWVIPLIQTCADGWVYLDTLASKHGERDSDYPDGEQNRMACESLP